MQNVDILPTLKARKCGGWLATSPHGSDIRIGVTADSEEAARTKFRMALAQWRTLLARDIPKSS